MGFFGNNSNLKALSLQVQALTRQNLALLGANVNRNIAVYAPWDMQDHSLRYTDTDDIYAIINMLSTTGALIPIYAYEVQDEKHYKQLSRLKQPHTNPYQAKMLQTKALKDLPEQDPLVQLLENPNSCQTKFEFQVAYNIFLLIHGEAFIYKMRVEYGKNGKTNQDDPNSKNDGLPSELHLLYPENVILRVSETLPRRVMGYDYRVNGVLVYENIPPEDIIHIKYFNPVMDIMGNELRGMSPLKALKKRLTRLSSNMDVSVAQMQNGGVPSIVYDKSFPDGLATEVQGKRKENFYKYLQDSSNKGAPYFATGEMGVIELGLKMADMQVAELAKIDFKKLCNAFGASDVLLNNDAASTESNVQVMEKRLYTNTVLPNVYRYRDGMIKGLIPDFARDKKKRDIREDISEITVLQADMKKMAETYAAMPFIIPNKMFEAFDLEQSTDPAMNDVYVKAGYSNLKDIQNIDPINPGENDPD